MELINSSNTEALDQTINGLPLSLKLKLLAIKHVQTQIEKLNNEFQSEITEILQKYYAQADSLSFNCNEVIEAKQLPNLEATRNLGEYFSSSEIIRAQEIPLTSKPFENFWFTTLLNSKLHVAILPEEEEALSFVDRVMMTTLITKRDKRYKIAFSFKENTFFSNKDLVCHIKYDHDNNLLEAKSNKINWFPDKNIYKIISNKSTASGGGFFKLFKRFDKHSPNPLLKKYRIDISFIASELIHDIIPNAFPVYLGVNKPKSTPK